MKKIMMIALTSVALINLSGCAASAQSAAAVAKSETAPVVAETQKAAETVKSETTKAATEVQKSAEQTTIGKRGLKLPNAANAASNKPEDKATLCLPDANEVLKCN